MPIIVGILTFMSMIIFCILLSCARKSLVILCRQYICDFLGRGLSSRPPPLGADSPRSPPLLPPVDSYMVKQGDPSENNIPIFIFTTVLPAKSDSDVMLCLQS